MAQCCASNNKYIAQCCASGINVGVQHASIWLDAATSTWLKDVHQALWFNAVYQASKWLNAVHHVSINYGSMLCIHDSLMCIRHQYGLMLCIRHHYGTILLILLNVVQALLYGPMLCKRHHNTAQTCASWCQLPGDSPFNLWHLSLMPINQQRPSQRLWHRTITNNDWRIVCVSVKSTCGIPLCNSPDF